MVVYTIGHSTRSLEEFIGILKAHGIERVVDVRSIPRSRHNPQFEGPFLARKLRSRRIRYLHLRLLGGRRHTRKDSVNLAWRSEAFRGFADYMQTEEFRLGISKLLRLAREHRTAILCAEAVPWRCHRSLIADALTARGMKVEHLTSKGPAREHALTPWAQVRGQSITYPAAQTRRKAA